MFPTSHIPYPKEVIRSREIQKGGNAPPGAPPCPSTSTPTNKAPSNTASTPSSASTTSKHPPKSQWWPSRPQPLYTKDGETHYWTDEEYHRLSTLAGGCVLRRLTNARLNWNSPALRDLMQAENALKAAREQARQEVQREMR
jgi:hypothetical protein